MCGESKVYIFGERYKYTPRWSRGYGLKDSNISGFRILLVAHAHVVGVLHTCVHFLRMVSILAQRNILVLSLSSTKSS